MRENITKFAETFIGLPDNFSRVSIEHRITKFDFLNVYLLIYCKYNSSYGIIKLDV